jgi:ABC-type polysaccharide/polyol phosphate export permease
MFGLRRIWARRELLWNLTARELKQRYKGSALGFLWTVLTPLFMSAVYVVFLRLLARGVPMEDILVGVFAWQFTVQCVNGGTMCVLGNGNLVKKVAFPREVLPISQTWANAVSYLLSMTVQVPALVWLLWGKGGPGWAAVPLFAFWFAWQCAFNLGMTMIVGGLNVYWRDTQHLVGVAMSAWFFMSPVMYNMGFLRGMMAGNEGLARLIDWLYVNPLVPILNGYRSALLPGAGMETPWQFWVGLALTPAVLFGGWLLYRRLQRNFADML